jgi:MoaA/NifB/PqqE/SkfB family radical SAM enzyme
LNCGPDKTEKLSPEAVKNCLKALPNIGISEFCISGGEPFLFLREIKDILAFANSLNLKTNLGTNGYWGVSYNKSFEILKQLSSFGLNMLLLSADKYHQKFISIERLINILNAAKDIGIKVKITVDMTKKDRESILIAKRLKDYDCLISLKEPKLVGRAIKNIKIDDIYNFTSKEKYIFSKCVQIDSPAITPDGRVWICCGIPFGKYYYTKHNNTPLVLGNIYEESLEQILRTNENNIILQILRTEGPIKFVDILERSSGKEYEFRNKYHEICELCCDILGPLKYPNIEEDTKRFTIEELYSGIV